MSIILPDDRSTALEALPCYTSTPSNYCLIFLFSSTSWYTTRSHDQQHAWPRRWNDSNGDNSRTKSNEFYSSSHLSLTDPSVKKLVLFIQKNCLWKYIISACAIRHTGLHVAVSNEGKMGYYVQLNPMNNNHFSISPKSQLIKKKKSFLPTLVLKHQANQTNLNSLCSTERKKEVWIFSWRNVQTGRYTPENASFIK